MILKSFELEKVDLKEKKIFLLYGENEGLKNELIERKFENNFIEKIYRYDEKEILNNQENFFQSVLSKSFFEAEKLIIITRATDKIKNIVKELNEKKIDDIIIVLNSGVLDKKSKLRNFFEKKKEIICVPSYNDNFQTLNTIINNFFKEKKIPCSQEMINVLIDRCRGDRQNLKNELLKIENFTKNKKKINFEEILKLTNLAENYNVVELIDNCLAKNKKKTINILNENNYSTEDCILIIRTMLSKAKRLHKLRKEIIQDQNIDQIILSFKPPIFWKDKEIVKQQIKNWSLSAIEKLIYSINEVELLIKKNSNNSVNILSDFIIINSKSSNN